MMFEGISQTLIAATLAVGAEGMSGDPVGTAFLLVRPDKYKYANPEDHNWEGAGIEEGWRIWYVTCAHIIDDIEAEGRRAVLRMNEEGQDGGVSSVKMPTSYWTRHPNWIPLWQGSSRRPYEISDVDHDVAVAIAPTHYEGWSELFHGAWPAHWHLNRNLIERYGLHEGSSALVTGFPGGGWYEGRKDWPLVRSAMIAQIGPYLRENTNTFLIDGNIFPGNSGGPVIGDVRRQKRRGTTQFPRHRLIGMVCATQTSNGDNAGLGVVVPTEKINETIDEALRIGIPGTIRE